MGSYSEKDPKARLIEELKKNYVAVRMQQGVPLLDSDWNVMVDILRNELYEGLDLISSSGVRAGSDSLKVTAKFPDPPRPGEIQDSTTKIKIAGGLALIRGRLINAKGDDWSVIFEKNKDQDKCVYIDVWEEEVNAQDDPAIMNEKLQAETCVRLQRKTEFNWVDGTKLPPAEEGHYLLQLAILHHRADYSHWVEDTRPFLGHKNPAYAMWINGHGGQIRLHKEPGETHSSSEGIIVKRTWGNIKLERKRKPDYKPNEDIEFDQLIHFAIPTPVLVNSNRLKLRRALIRFQTFDGASIEKVYISDGDKKIHEDRKKRQSNKVDTQRIDIAINELPEIYWGVGISVSIKFPKLLNINPNYSPSIQFFSAGCDFWL